MRVLAFVLAFTGFCLSASASTRITVSELAHALAGDRGKVDADVASKLSDLELTERLSTAGLARLQAYSPGPKTSQELEILAGQSEFLALPATEIPATPAPNAETQRQIMGLVVNYVTKTIHQSPNFLATRVTRSFEDQPAGLFGNLPLHLMGQSAASVIYQNGQEVVTVDAKAKKAGAAGLVSWGEFGPVLSTVLLDAAQSQLSWSHWESDAVSALAVFRYKVPTEKSHYEVQYDCVQGYVADASIPEDPCGGKVYRSLAGYQGEIAVDPATGAVLRMTVVADLPSGAPLTAAAIMVQYGAVEIGGKSYVCPVRSVALAQVRQVLPVGGSTWSSSITRPGPMKTRLNEVAFEQYHIFRSETRMLTASEADEQNQPPAASQSASEAQTAATNAPIDPQEPVQTANRVGPPGAGSSANAGEPNSGAPATASAAPPAPSTLSATETNTPATDQTPLFKTTAHDVVVDVVVTKGNGDQVTGLDKQDFELSENGKPQRIDFFEAHTGNAPPAGPPPEMPMLPAGMRTNVTAAPPGNAVNVLLIDTLNTGLQDQAFVRKSVLQFLAKMQPGTRMAIFALGSKLRCIQGFTTDNSALLAALNDKKTGLNGQKSDFLQTASDKADVADDAAALRAMRASEFAIGALQAAVADTGARDFAARASMTFQALMYLGHYLSGVPGRKNLIWFAGSFPMMIFPTAEQRAQLRQNPNLPGYADRVKATADLFTLSQIAVYPISAEGLTTDNMGGADMAGPGGASVGHIGSVASYDPDNPGNSTMGPYHAAAVERANTTYAMNQLAASTGGKAYYNTNDLDKALERAIEDGANYYTVGYSPTDAKMDGSYRQIEVKLAHGRYQLAYRRGYNADPGPPAEVTPAFDPLTPLLQPGLPGATGVLYGVHAEIATDKTSSAVPFAGQNTKVQSPLTRYTVNFVIRGQDVLYTPNATGGRSGKYLLGLKAYDREGNAVNWAGNEENVDVAPDQYGAVRKNGIPARLEIDVPSGRDVQLVTAVYDMNSGEAGTVEISLHPGSQVEGSQSAAGATKHP